MKNSPLRWLRQIGLSHLKFQISREFIQACADQDLVALKRVIMNSQVSDDVKKEVAQKIKNDGGDDTFELGIAGWQPKLSGGEVSTKSTLSAIYKTTSILSAVYKTTSPFSFSSHTGTFVSAQKYSPPRHDFLGHTSSGRWLVNHWDNQALNSNLRFRLAEALGWIKIVDVAEESQEVNSYWIHPTNHTVGLYSFSGNSMFRVIEEQYRHIICYDGENRGSLGFPEWEYDLVHMGILVSWLRGFGFPNAIEIKETESRPAYVCRILNHTPSKNEFFGDSALGALTTAIIEWLSRFGEKIKEKPKYLISDQDILAGTVSMEIHGAYSGDHCNIPCICGRPVSLYRCVHCRIESIYKASYNSF